MKKLLVMGLAMAVSSAAFASDANPKVIKVAQRSIVHYGLYRIAGLGGAHGNELTQNKICGLAGQALTGFQVLKAAEVSEAELADLLQGLSQVGVKVEHVRAQLELDVAECSK